MKNKSDGTLCDLWHIKLAHRYDIVLLPANASDAMDVRLLFRSDLREKKVRSNFSQGMETVQNHELIYTV